MELVNLSDFASQFYITMSREMRETLVVVVKATFDLPIENAPVLSDPDPIRFADEYLGDPTKTSVLYPADAVLYKPTAEVLLVGSAFSVQRKNIVDVRLRFDNLVKTVTVFGDRHWERTKPSTPLPFERMPLIYERAFGGEDTSVPGGAAGCGRNPVGVGFRAAHSRVPIDGSPIPNLENGTQLIKKPDQRPDPACFGPIGPGWQPRVSYAGTYDNVWLRERMPWLPGDFDDRFNLCAPGDQVLDHYLRGGEIVEVDGATPTSRLSFVVPHHKPTVKAKLGLKHESPSCCGDTVVIDTDRMVLTLTWRASIDIHGRLDAVDWIKVDAG